MSGLSPLLIFEHSKSGNIVSRGIKQRLIIISLAYTQVADTTRGVLAKHLAAKLRTSRANAYHYVYKELVECLIPNGIIEETDATIRPIKGPGQLQDQGIPCYRLTSLGMLVASSLEELGIKKQMDLLESYLIYSKVHDATEFAVNERLLSMLRKHSEHTISLVSYSVRDFVHRRSAQPLDAIVREYNTAYCSW